MNLATSTYSNREVFCEMLTTIIPDWNRREERLERSIGGPK